MANNVKVLFWLKASRTNKKGLAPLMLRITYNNQRKNISTGFNIEPSKWDNQKYRVKAKANESIVINQFIDVARARILELSKDMFINGEINLEKIAACYQGKDDKNLTLLGLVKQHNENFKSRLGIDYAESTYENYAITEKRLISFIKFKFNTTDVTLKQLNKQFIMDFDFYLKKTHLNDHNTATKYCKNLKRILNYAVEHEYIENNPFSYFICTYNDVERVYLSNLELNAIEDKNFTIKRLQIVKDLFLFQCYTGLSFCDMSKLTKVDINTGIDNNKWIITRRQKTNTRSAIPLLPKALAILDKYINSKSDNLLPSISNQKFNSYLSEISELCNINKNITSHVGRRTFATTIALGNGISLETVSKILGHTNTKITQQYAVVTDLKISQDMNQLREKLI